MCYVSLKMAEVKSWQTIDGHMTCGDGKGRREAGEDDDIWKSLSAHLQFFEIHSQNFSTLSQDVTWKLTIDLNKPCFRRQKCSQGHLYDSHHIKQTSVT